MTFAPTDRAGEGGAGAETVAVRGGTCAAPAALASSRSSGRPPLSAIDRFFKYVMPEPNSGCWLWIAYVDPAGYARLRGDGTTLYGHRLAYEHFVGPIPEGLEIDHLCRVRACVNPAHLEAVTHTENTRRGLVSGLRPYCGRGHLYTGATTRIQPFSGHRRCRICEREYAQKRWQRRLRERMAA